MLSRLRFDGLSKKKTLRPSLAYRDMVPLPDDDDAVIERLLDRVYDLVVAHSEGISLTSLCEQAGLCREAIEAAVEQLEELGFMERWGSLVTKKAVIPSGVVAPTAGGSRT